MSHSIHHRVEDRERSYSVIKLNARFGIANASQTIALWLRFYDSTRALVLLPEEAAQQQAASERLRAERLAARLRELGEDPDLL
jgi:hypothetical protein